MEKYPVLGLIRFLLSLGGWLMVILGGLSIVWGLSDFSAQGNYAAVAQGWLKLSSGIGLVFGGLIAIAVSEALTVVVNIEINTRPRPSQGDALSQDRPPRSTETTQSATAPPPSILHP
jgi:hypothetical protein